MSLWNWLIIFYCVISMVKICCCETNAKGRLLKNLFDNYDKDLRPVLNGTATISVGIRFGVMQLLNVVDKSKSFQTVSYMASLWRDEFLTWNPSEYNNITEIRYSHKAIWMPDIILANTPDLDDGPITVRASTNMIIDYKGNVKNAFTAVFTATCVSMDLTRFPFDEHRCFFDFTSWTYNSDYLQLYDDTASRVIGMRKAYIPNAEWDFIITGSETIMDTECCPTEMYQVLRIYVHLKRKPLYYVVNLVVPTCITCYIAFVGMFSPSTNTGERTEKAFLGITALLAVAMLMMSVSAQMPVTSTAVPLMGYFLGTFVVTIAVAIICTAIIMNIDVHGLKGRPLPHWTRVWFLERLGTWLLVCDHPNKKNSSWSDIKSKIHPNLPSTDIEPNYKQSELISTLETTMKHHFDIFYNSILHVKAEKEETRKNREEWATLCRVLDRICLLVFIIWSTGFTIVVMS